MAPSRHGALKICASGLTSTPSVRSFRGHSFPNPVADRSLTCRPPRQVAAITHRMGAGAAAVWPPAPHQARAVRQAARPPGPAPLPSALPDPLSRLGRPGRGRSVVPQFDPGPLHLVDQGPAAGSAAGLFFILEGCCELCCEFSSQLASVSAAAAPAAPSPLRLLIGRDNRALWRHSPNWARIQALGGLSPSWLAHPDTTASHSTRWVRSVRACPFGVTSQLRGQRELGWSNSCASIVPSPGY